MKNFNCAYYQYNSISSTDTVLVNYMCTHWLNDDQIYRHTHTHTHKKHRSNTTASGSISLFTKVFSNTELSWTKLICKKKKKKIDIIFLTAKKNHFMYNRSFFFLQDLASTPMFHQKNPQLHHSGISIISYILFPDGVLCRNSHIPFHSSVSHINPQDLG